MVDEIDFSKLTLKDGINKLQNKTENVEDAIMAQCEEMCPEEERNFREKNGLLHRLELCELSDWKSYKARFGKTNAKMDNFYIPGFTDKTRAVKQFKRSSAGENLMVLAHIRPTGTLKATVDYLCGDLINRAVKLESKSIIAFGHYYDFTFDRLRSIRQDLTLQRALNADCLYILERCIEFYLYSNYIHLMFKMVASEADLQALSGHVNLHDNNKHLIQCLELLMDYYDHFDKVFWSHSRPIFESINLLADLNSSSRNERFSLFRRSSSTCSLHDCDTIRITNRLRSEYLIGNMIKCLQLARKQFRKNKHLYSLAFYSLALPNVHLKLVKQICVSCRSSNTVIPISSISEWFCPDSFHVKWCILYLERLFRSLGIPIENAKMDSFNNPDGGDTQEKMIVIKKVFESMQQWREITEINPNGWLPAINNLYGLFLSLQKC